MLHQYLQDELCENKSLSALVYLVEQGREFEFSYNGALCLFLSQKNKKRFRFVLIKRNMYLIILQN